MEQQLEKYQQNDNKSTNNNGFGLVYFKAQCINNNHHNATTSTTIKKSENMTNSGNITLYRCWEKDNAWALGKNYIRRKKNETNTGIN